MAFGRLDVRLVPDRRNTFLGRFFIAMRLLELSGKSYTVTDNISALFLQPKCIYLTTQVASLRVVHSGEPYSVWACWSN